MNKEYKEFCRENEGITEELLASLKGLLAKFEKRIVPGEPEKSDALYRLDVYKDAVELFYRTELPVFKRIPAEVKAFDEGNIYKELSAIKGSISILVKLVREKLIAKDDLIFISDAGKALLNGGFCDEIVVDGSQKTYYTLSAKAEKILKNKKFADKIRKEFVTAIIPSGMILESQKWNNIYVKRVEFLKQFYEQSRCDKEYILFTLDDAKEMVFACELDKSEAVNYVFAGIFDEKINDNVNQLIYLSNSGMIDNIEIIIDSPEMENILEEYGIGSKKTPHISIVHLW